MQQQVVDAERVSVFNKEKLKKVFSLDNIVDAAVDLFLVLFDVITSPILIVMRMIRWTVGTYILDGLKNKIKNRIFSPETIIFNTTVKTKEELLSDFELKISSSWLSKFF